MKIIMTDPELNEFLSREQFEGKNLIRNNFIHTLTDEV